MLQLTEVTKRYADVVALDGLSMTVGPGRIHGFVGRNGAGKTTTMRIVLGLAEPDDGEVLWKGAPVTAADQVTYFARLSGMPAAAARAAATSVLDSMGLADRATDPVEQLSLGNQQRAQLAAALVTTPELLVLDEPFSGLDPVGVDVLAGVLQSQVDEGTAVVFSSHQLELVERLSDEVTIIDQGRVVASGDVSAVRRSRGGDQLRVAVEGAGAAWADHLDGAKVIGHDADTVVFELVPGADDQAVLDAARRAGRVRLFQREAPSLTELFREVVSR